MLVFWKIFVEGVRRVNWLVGLSCVLACIFEDNFRTTRMFWETILDQISWYFLHCSYLVETLLHRRPCHVRWPSMIHWNYVLQPLHQSESLLRASRQDLYSFWRCWSVSDSIKGALSRSGVWSSSLVKMGGEYPKNATRKATSIIPTKPKSRKLPMEKEEARKLGSVWGRAVLVWFECLGNSRAINGLEFISIGADWWNDWSDTIEWRDKEEALGKYSNERMRKKCRCCVRRCGKSEMKGPPAIKVARLRSRTRKTKTKKT